MRDSLPWGIKRQQINVKIYSTSIAIEKMQIKIMISYCCTPVRMAKILKNDTNCLQGYRETRLLVYYWWECKVVQPHWKKIMTVSYKVALAITIKLSNCTPGHLSQRMGKLCSHKTP